MDATCARRWRSAACRPAPEPTVAEPLLDEKVLALGRALDDAALPHAFGGAIALAWCGVPRGTEDIDLNLFVGSEREAACLAAVAPLGVERADVPAERPHQALWRWGRTPLHAFFAYHPFHESCRARARRVPFAGGEITVLAAEDIAVFKLVYDRPRDRSEVREVLLCLGERFDSAYAEQWLARILGARDDRVARFRAMAAELAPRAT